MASSGLLDSSETSFDNFKTELLRRFSQATEEQLFRAMCEFCLRFPETNEYASNGIRWLDRYEPAPLPDDMSAFVTQMYEISAEDFHETDDYGGCIICNYHGSGRGDEMWIDMSCPFCNSHYKYKELHDLGITPARPNMSEDNSHDDDSEDTEPHEYTRVYRLLSPDPNGRSWWHIPLPPPRSPSP